MKGLTKKQELVIYFILTIIGLFVFYKVISNQMTKARFTTLRDEISGIKSRYDNDKKSFCIKKASRFPVAGGEYDITLSRCTEILSNTEMTEERALGIINNEVNYEDYLQEMQNLWLSSK